MGINSNLWFLYLSSIFLLVVNDDSEWFNNLQIIYSNNQYETKNNTTSVNSRVYISSNSTKIPAFYTGFGIFVLTWSTIACTALFIYCSIELIINQRHIQKTSNKSTVHTSRQKYQINKPHTVPTKHHCLCNTSLLPKFNRYKTLSSLITKSYFRSMIFDLFHLRDFRNNKSNYYDINNNNNRNRKPVGDLVAFLDSLQEMIRELNQSNVCGDVRPSNSRNHYNISKSKKKMSCCCYRIRKTSTKRDMSPPAIIHPNNQPRPLNQVPQNRDDRPAFHMNPTPNTAHFAPIARHQSKPMTLSPYQPNPVANPPNNELRGIGSQMYQYRNNASTSVAKPSPYMNTACGESISHHQSHAANPPTYPSYPKTYHSQDPISQHQNQSQSSLTQPSPKTITSPRLRPYFGPPHRHQDLSNFDPTYRTNYESLQKMPPDPISVDISSEFDNSKKSTVKFRIIPNDQSELTPFVKTQTAANDQSEASPLSQSFKPCDNQFPQEDPLALRPLLNFKNHHIPNVCDERKDVPNVILRKYDIPSSVSNPTVNTQPIVQPQRPNFIAPVSINYPTQATDIYINPHSENSQTRNSCCTKKQKT